MYRQNEFDACAIFGHAPIKAYLYIISIELPVDPKFRHTCKYIWEFNVSIVRVCLSLSLNVLCY